MCSHYENWIFPWTEIELDVSNELIVGLYEFNEKTNSIYTCDFNSQYSIHMMYISHVGNLLHDGYICSGNFQAI